MRTDPCDRCESMLADNPESAREWYEAGHHICRLAKWAWMVPGARCEYAPSGPHDPWFSARIASEPRWLGDHTPVVRLEDLPAAYGEYTHKPEHKRWVVAAAACSHVRRQVDDSGAVFWAIEGEERLSHRDIDDAVEDHLDGLDPWPETLTLVGFARMSADFPEPRSVVEEIVECVDEELGDPDGDGPEITPAMIAAAQALIDVIKRDYEPWACEECARREVNVDEWVCANRPEWVWKEDGDGHHL